MAGIIVSSGIIGGSISPKVEFTLDRARRMPVTKDRRDEAEADVIHLLRLNNSENFTLTISCRARKWRVELVDHAALATVPPSTGDTFADAWHGLEPDLGERER